MLGAHVSVAGGLHNAFTEAKALKCEAIQIFSKNQRQWKSKSLEPQAVDEWKEGRRTSKVKGILIHDSYLINLADPTAAGVKRAREAFKEEIRRAEALQVPNLVFHPGAHVGKGEAWAIRRIVQSLNFCMGDLGSRGPVLLVENTAGQGSTVGHRLEHLQVIVEGVSDPTKIGICLDTCHTFAAGYDLRTPEGYEDLMHRVEETVGLSKVRAFHLNDSKKELDCRVDRHEHIGKGQLGLEAFRHLVNDPRFEEVPMVLETPGELKDFRRNLRVLRSLRANH